MIKNQFNEKLSLIIPLYNGENYIEQCLDAALLQDYPNYEIIVVDDASTDDSLSLIEKYSVEIVRMSQNSGAAAARNAGAKQADSKYCVFIDSDVVIPRDALSRIKRSHDIHPEIAIVVGDYSENSMHLNFISDYKNLELVYRGSTGDEYKKYAASYFLFIRKEDYLKAGGFNENLKGTTTAEDIDFGLRVCRGEARVFYDRSLTVDHLKTYTFYEMLQTNYHRIVNMVRVRHNHEVPLDISSNASIEPILNLFLPILILIFLFSAILQIASLYFSTSAALFYLGLNTPFFNYLRIRRGNMFVLKAIPVFFVEYLHAFISLCIGFTLYPPPTFKKRLNQ